MRVGRIVLSGLAVGVLCLGISLMPGGDAARAASEHEVAHENPPRVTFDRGKNILMPGEEK